MKTGFRFSILAMGVVALGACGTMCPLQQVTPEPVAVVADEPYQSVNEKQIARAEVADAVVELAFSPKQNAVFVSAPDWKDESKSRVLRLDPQTLAVQAEIPLTEKGFGVALDDGADRLYLTQGFNGSISVVDTARNERIKRIRVMEKINFAQELERLQFSEKRKNFLLEQLSKFKVEEDYPWKLREIVVDTRNGRLFAPGLGLGTDSVLIVINTRTLELEKIIPGMGYNAVGIALDSARGRVFVSNMQGQITVVDARTLQVTGVLEVQADQLLNLVYDPQGNRLFGVDQGIDRDMWRNNHLEREYQHRSEGHRVFALNADTGAVIANMPAGEVPIGLVFDARRQRLYVTSRGGVRVEQGKGSLGVYDTVHYQRLQDIELLPHPNSLALDAQGNALYVTVKNDGQAAKAARQESVVRIGF